jgi:hypothetical protein
MARPFSDVAMFDYEEKPSIFSAIKIGRITFGVFVFLSWAMLIHLLFSHPDNMAEGLADMLLGMIMFVTATSLTIISTICVFYLRAQKRRSRFWITAAAIAALPLVIAFIVAIS